MCQTEQEKLLLHFQPAERLYYDDESAALLGCVHLMRSSALQPAQTTSEKKHKKTSRTNSQNNIHHKWKPPSDTFSSALTENIPYCLTYKLHLLHNFHATDSLK